jgi:citrate synthase
MEEYAMPHAVSKGLQDVIVGDSAISLVDGKKGRLLYRGVDISDLAAHSTFEETVYLLWHGEFPTRAQLDDFESRLAGRRELPDVVWNMLTSFPCWPQPMEALRSSVSALSACDAYAEDHSHEAALSLTAKLPTIVASYYRHSTSQKRVPPDPKLSHAANFLYMLRGEVPEAFEQKVMDTALILMADHEFNASTFAARVTASTLSDMYSAITSAIGTLKGPLHGGANERVMEMLLEIGEPDKVDKYINHALESGKRIMGFGHRVYKTMDPRATVLKDIVCEMDSHAQDPRWCRMSTRIMEVVLDRKGLYPNVDFFSAPLLYTIGIPINLFTPIFAISRIAGWTAHVLEQYADNRLIRPLSNYTGPEDKPYVPIERR